MQDPFIQILSDQDPIPALHELRASDPVHFVESLGFWVVTRHDDIHRLFNDPDCVTQDKRVWSFYVQSPEGSMQRWLEDRGIMALAGPEHKRLRRLVSAAVTPRAVRRMEKQIAEVVERIAEPLYQREGEVVDLMGAFTNVVPNAVMSRVTGVPPGEDEQRFCEIAQAVIPGFLPFTTDEIKENSERGFREFSAWIREMVSIRRENPEDDLVSDLVRAQDEDDTLSEDDIVLLLASLIGAGSEATAQVGTLIARELLKHPDNFDRLYQDRTLIHKAMDEILRYCFSLPAGAMRFAVRDFELRDKKISKGQMIMLSGGGANRDPEVYANPDVFDLDRSVPQLLTFGFGPHFCIGANIARQEIASMINVMLDILPSGSWLREDEIEYRDLGVFQQAMNLPVYIGIRSTN